MGMFVLTIIDTYNLIIMHCIIMLPGPGPGPVLCMFHDITSGAPY